MKKFLAVLLTVVLMVSVLPMGIFTITTSAATEYTSGYYTYSVSNGKATIIDCNRSISGAVTIPSNLGGYPVTSIGERAFSSCSSLTSITIPDSVTSIGEGAFEGCSGLQSITLPFVGSSRTASGSYDAVFGYIFGYTSSYSTYEIFQYFSGQTGRCYYIPLSLKSVTITDTTQIPYGAFSDCSKFTSITIPDSVTSIGGRAFRDCSNLTSITIPDSVTSIGYEAFYNTGYYSNSSNWKNNVLYIGKHLIKADSISGTYAIKQGTLTIAGSAFSGCSNLTSITIPDSVTGIGSSAFSGCSNFTSITIPDSVMSIGAGAFWNCSRLTSITVNSNNKYYSSQDGVLFNKNKTQLVEYPAGKASTIYTIPDSVTSIGDRAFYNCDSLISITIPDSVTSIGEYAFAYCDSLISITIPDSVTSIGNYAFYSTGYYSKSSNWKNNVLYIGKHLIKADSISGTYAIKQGTLTIAGSAFSGRSNLTSITIPDSVTSIGDSAFYNCESLTSITIPNSVTSIGDYAFRECNILTSVTIGNSVTSIGGSAFYNCESLTSITIPNSVTSIGEYAFYNCESLTSITIGNSVTSIGDYAFYKCSNLTSITIPDSVTSIGEGAFEGCSSLKNITLPFVGSSRTASGTKDAVFGYIFGYTSSSTSETTKQYYSSNSSYYYYYIPASLKTVIITDATQIPYGAFYNCSNLTSVTIPNSVTSIGGSAFYGCASLASITIPDSVTSIGGSAFYGCANLTSTNLGNSVTSIGSSAFYNCTNLTKVYITDLKAWCEIDFGSSYANPLYYTDELYLNGKLLSGKVTIPEGTTKIGIYAFYNQSNITSITIPNSVTSIGGSAFYNCESLTSITIPDSVTSIGEGAFKGCSGLESITLPFVGSSRTASGTKDAVFGYIFGYTSSSTSETTKQYYSSNSSYYYYIPSSLNSVTLTDATQIPYGAFYNCSNLTSITIPDGVTSIGGSAFSYCSNLTSVTIPDSVTSIGSSAFSGIGTIDTVYYGGTPQKWNTLKSNSGISYKNIVFNDITINVNTLPSKTVYNENVDSLDLTGGKISVVGTSGEPDIVDMTNSSVKVTGFDNTKLGKQILTVTYYGASTTFEIEIVELPQNTTEFAGGKGIASSPYLVSTKEHLNNVRNYPNAYFKQIANITFTASDFASGGTYYNNGIGWNPIGKNSSSTFTGTYDGNGYKISNLKVNITTTSSAYGGLFGYSSGVLKNINVENGSISVKADGTPYAGGIVGYTKGSIINCHNINTSVQSNIAGGIVGYAYYPKIISTCSNSGHIDGTYTGGIVGQISTSTISGSGSYDDSDAVIINCTNSGELSRNTTSGSYIGGIAGQQMSGTLVIRNCTNDGKIYAEGSDLSSISMGGCPCVGGVLGYATNANIMNCKNSGNLYGDAVGGIVGYGVVIIGECENDGEIKGRNWIGGIVGYHSNGSVTDSLNKGNVVGVRYVNGSVSRDYSTAAGGIVGSTQSAGSVYYCANIGDVSNGEYTGGIAGVGDLVAVCYNTGNISGKTYAAGICGKFLDSGSQLFDCFNEGNVSGKYAAGILAEFTTGSIKQSYNVGRITASQSGGYIGAIVAYQTKSGVTSCYYLDNMNVGVGYIDYSISTTPDTTKLSSAQMQSSSSFTGFDFSSVWTMDGHEEYLYPELRSVEMIFKAYTAGDLTGDDKINSLDGLMLLRHLNGWTLNIASPEAMDVNADGKVNSLDGLMLLRYLNGWNITLG